jgi:propanediol utilization protein
VRKDFTVSKNSNGAAIEVSSQTHVRIYDADGNLVFSDRSDTYEVHPLLAPGKYVVETDGRLKSIRSSTKGEQELD